MEKFITIKGLKLNIEKAIKRVKLDLKDDWFQDPLMYDDILTLDFISKKISKYDGRDDDYKAGKAIHIDIPKPGFTIRYSTETDIVDRVIFQALIDVIAEELDSLHSNNIYSFRINKRRDDEKYFFRYAVEEWKKFIADTALELDAGNNVLLITDLANFYENIGIKDLKDVLDLFIPENDKAQDYKVCTDLIKSILESWCERNTKRGIPQNRDASSFIANIFLHPVDDTMIKSGYNYFRYADDIRIVCKTKFEAKKALKYLILELRKKGLNVNSKKTQILDYDNPKQRDDIKKLLSNADPKIDQIEALIRSRTARDVQIAIPMLRSKVLSLIENKNTGDREFRYCINRLERISRNDKLAEKIDFEPITKSILNELIEQPWSTDIFARYLGSVTLGADDIQIIKNLLLDRSKNIYEWQSFYLWCLLTRHKFKDSEVIKIARENIEFQNDIPTTAASCLYLGANGDPNDKKFVAENFKRFGDHLTQRLALIAIKDLSYSAIIKPHVKDHILENYKESYKILSEKYKNQFQLPIEKLKEDDIYEDLPDNIS
jgi:retron-type reverse transcriptase